MTRDDTVNFFLECEAKRSDAHAAALTEGKNEYQADDIAHEAAKAHWNAWAQAALAERKTTSRAKTKFTDAGEPADEATRAMVDSDSRAKVDFDFCLFLNEGIAEEEAAQAQAELDKKAAERNIQVIVVPVNNRRTLFEGFIFPGSASFEGAVFLSNAMFRGAIFTDLTGFEGATFDRAYFDEATFDDDTWFNRVTFTEDAFFGGATFNGEVSFERSSFTDNASFESTTFNGNASFEKAIFTGDAIFSNTTFIWGAAFRGQTFNDVFFNKAKFGRESFADFSLATFKRVAQFDNAVFEGEADFNSVFSERTFSMAGCRFEGVPDFIQAHFGEAPRLDNVKVKGYLLALKQEESQENQQTTWLRWIHRRWRQKSYHYWRLTSASVEGSPLRNTPARWRALKRLAIQGHDTDRELKFFSGEFRSARFAGDWPLPWLPSTPWIVLAWSRVVGSVSRFWAGVLYEVFSNFGSSLLRPFLAWAFCVCVFAAVYLSQTEVMQRNMVLKDVWWGSAAAQAGHYALANTVPCYPPPTYTGNWRKNWSLWEKPKSDAASNSTETIVGGLSEKLRNQTNARAEALHLAFRNAFVVLDGGSDSSHRMYGCLYGLELYAGQNPVPIVPSAVSTASAIQKLISGVLIFLFGLAVRNMLKVK